MDLSNKKKIALVLSGGGVKAAAFHIGVCLALREKGFKFAGGTSEEVQAKYSDGNMTIKLYVGSSAGSVVSSFLASGYSLNAIVKAFERGSSDLLESFEGYEDLDEDSIRPLSYKDLFAINGKDILKMIPSLIKNTSGSIVSGGLEVLIKNGFSLNGLFTTKGLEKYIREEVCTTNTFGSLGVELFIVATQLNHSRKVIFCAKDELSKDKAVLYADYSTISEAVAASTSLPPVFAPFPIKNKKNEPTYFFDGEIRDTMSTHVAVDHGADLVIASNSIQPYHYNKSMGSLHEYGIPVILNQALYQVVQQKIEQHVRRGKEIASVYNAVSGYLKQINIPDEQREKLLSIITERTNYSPETDFIYINPDPQDYNTFFADHFSLNGEILRNTVQAGFRSAISTLRKLDI